MIFPRKYNDKETDLILSKLTVIIDSREKVNTHITSQFDKANIKHEVRKLNHGDYSFIIPPIPELNIYEEMSLVDRISIERKSSLDEIAGNITKDRERFKREFERHKGLMILLIETNTYADIFNHNYQSKLSPQSFVGTLHSWSIKHSVPFIFISKDYVAQYIYFTFYYYLRYLLKTDNKI